MEMKRLDKESAEIMKTIVMRETETPIKSIYHECSVVETGSPKRNLHDSLHVILPGKYDDLLDNIFLKRFKKNEFH